MRTRVCLVCGSVQEQEVIPATGHSMGSWTVTKEADCATEGQRVRTCGNCGAAETETIAKTEHTMGLWEETKAPTCTEEGLQLRSCLVCKAIEEATIPAAGHSTDMECIHTVTVELVPEKEFLCEYGGYCSVCGDYVVLKKNHKVLMGDDGFACEICGSVAIEIVGL